VANEARSLTKATLLIALTMLVGGAEIARASTVTSVGPVTFGPFNFGNLNGTANIDQFNPLQGTLTEVEIDLTSQLVDVPTARVGAEVTSPSGDLTGSTFIATIDSAGDPVSYDSTTTYSSSLGSYQGTGQFPLHFEYFTDCTLVGSGNTCGDGWSGSVTVKYTYDATTPVPAALPLFATGIGGLGLLGWRRKRKGTAAIAAA
jgi:hypothetical protein